MNMMTIYGMMLDWQLHSTWDFEMAFRGGGVGGNMHLLVF